MKRRVRDINSVRRILKSGGRSFDKLLSDLKNQKSHNGQKRIQIPVKAQLSYILRVEKEFYQMKGIWYLLGQRPRP